MTSDLGAVDRRRLRAGAHAGAVLTTTLAVTTEPLRDWAGALAAPAFDVIRRCFSELPKLTDQVGVAKAQKLAAAGEPAR